MTKKRSYTLKPIGRAIIVITALLIVALLGFMFWQAKGFHQPSSINSSVQSPPTMPSPTPQLSPAQLLGNKEQYFDKKVTLTGTLYFDEICAPQLSTLPCSTMAYLLEPTKITNSPLDLSGQIHLYQKGAFVGCSVTGVRPQNCSTWINQHPYEVTGTFKHLTVQGKTLPQLIIDIETSRSL